MTLQTLLHIVNTYKAYT